LDHRSSCRSPDISDTTVDGPLDARLNGLLAAPADGPPELSEEGPALTRKLRLNLL
jgi:hypothetical protein